MEDLKNKVIKEIESSNDLYELLEEQGREVTLNDVYVEFEDGSCLDCSVDLTIYNVEDDASVGYTGAGVIIENINRIYNIQTD